jgi:uncharacterized protein
MKYNYLINTITTLLLCLGSASLYATDSSQRQQVETLFRLTQMEKKIQESVDSVVQLQLRQNPQLAEHEKAMHDFFNKYIGWNALKDELADMYMQRFTEQELTDINAFYITPVGQKVITVLPELVQQRNQLAMMRLQQNIGELQQIIGTNSAAGTK